MTNDPSQSNIPDEQPAAAVPLSQCGVTEQQQADLNDPNKQAEYLAAFNEQLRRRYCPGCGES